MERTKIYRSKTHILSEHYIFIIYIAVTIYKTKEGAILFYNFQESLILTSVLEAIYNCKTAAKLKGSGGREAEFIVK